MDKVKGNVEHPSEDEGQEESESSEINIALCAVGKERPSKQNCQWKMHGKTLTRTFLQPS